MRTLVWSIILERHIFHALPSVLKPLDDWGSFRPGSRAAAVTALLYERSGEICVPFVVRRPDLPDHPGQVALPGGTVKPGEDAWPAAAREVTEEIGVHSSELEPLGAGEVVYTAVTNFCVVPFVARLRRPDTIFSHDPGELVAVLEVPLERLLDRRAWVLGTQEWMGELFEWEGSTIWGLTGRILADLLPRFRQALEVAG
jgi:8-oxo-dGTP pyrophosphatase MutT (NUDIX family)